MEAYLLSLSCPSGRVGDWGSAGTRPLAMAPASRQHPRVRSRDSEHYLLVSLHHRAFFDSAKPLAFAFQESILFLPENPLVGSLCPHKATTMKSLMLLGAAALATAQPWGPVVNLPGLPANSNLSMYSGYVTVNA